jgi:hypothetical protein
MTNLKNQIFITEVPQDITTGKKWVITNPAIGVLGYIYSVCEDPFDEEPVDWIAIESPHDWPNAYIRASNSHAGKGDYISNSGYIDVTFREPKVSRS